MRQALELLGQGFVEHPGNDALRDALAAGRLTDSDFYRQLLRLIYRLLFLMVAEERRLVQLDGAEHAGHQQLYAAWYGVGRLRDRAERRRGDDRHGDLWRGLAQTFHLFRNDEAAMALGLGVLDGELFGLDACPSLEPAQLRNDTVLQAIWALSTFEEQSKTKKRLGRRRVSYAALDVEELGSVYEGLLELHPKADPAAKSFGFVQGTERKSTGSYYTPKELVAELIKSALEPVLAERLAAAPTREEKERAILAIRVCDPAAGSGHFLLAAARRLGRELAIVRSGEAEPTPIAYRRAVRDVVRHCLYAVDRNPLAVDLCKVALWLESQAPGVPLSFLDHRVRCGDALVGVFDLGVLQGGIPDEAFKALTGDDKEVAKALAKRNKAERKASLFQAQAAQDLKGFAAALGALDAIDEPDPAGVAAKAERYQAVHDDPAWTRWKTACDLWCAAYYAPKTEAWAKRVPTTAHVWQALADPARLSSRAARPCGEPRRGSGCPPLAAWNSPRSWPPAASTSCWATRPGSGSSSRSRSSSPRAIRKLPRRRTRPARQNYDRRPCYGPGGFGQTGATRRIPASQALRRGRQCVRPDEHSFPADGDRRRQHLRAVRRAILSSRLSTCWAGGLDRADGYRHRQHDEGLL